MESWIDFKIDVDVDDILRGEGADPARIRARKPVLVHAAEHARDVGRSLVHPAALVGEFPVTSHSHDLLLLPDSHRLSGSLVAAHLAHAQSISAVLLTIGSELESVSSRLFSTDPIQSLALDGFANAVVESLGEQVCQRISAQAAAVGLEASTPLSPGEPGWPVEVGQPELFSLLDAGQLGIQLGSGAMMTPRKSISFVVGLGNEMVREDLCLVCNLRDTCRYHD